MTLLWTIVVVLFVNYVFGVFAVLFIGDSNAYDRSIESERIAQDYFSGIWGTIFTLIQVMTGDSWASAVARPVIAVQGIGMTLFFYTFVGVAMLVLLNLITAVIVDNALTIHAQDDEHRLAELER